MAVASLHVVERKVRKTIKYKVGEEENIGDIPCGAIITNAVLVHEGDSDDGLVYLPRLVRFEFKGEEGIDGPQHRCGSLSFAEKHVDTWARSSINYINLKSKDKTFEKKKKCK
jgi:hypothetical protein